MGDAWFGGRDVIAGGWYAFDAMKKGTGPIST
jgi:hypothetical protein